MQRPNEEEKVNALLAELIPYGHGYLAKNWNSYNSEIREDFLRETSLRFYKHALNHILNDDPNICKRLFIGMLKRVVIDHGRKKTNQEVADGFCDDDSLAARCVEGNDDGFGLVELEELLRVTFSEKEISVVHLRSDGYTLEEVAEILGMSCDMVRKLLRSSRNKYEQSLIDW